MISKISLNNTCFCLPFLSSKFLNPFLLVIRLENAPPPRWRGNDFPNGSYKVNLLPMIYNTCTHKYFRQQTYTQKKKKTSLRFLSHLCIQWLPHGHRELILVWNKNFPLHFRGLFDRGSVCASPCQILAYK